MSQIINWLRKSTGKVVHVVYDFGTDIGDIEDQINNITDLTDYNAVMDVFNNLSENQGTVFLNHDLTLQDLQNAAQTNYEITSSEYKPYQWKEEGQFLLLLDKDDDVRCLIMTDIPKEQRLKGILKRFNWKGKDTNS